MSHTIGTMIRRERLRQNLSQEGLCRGICAVSYLSRIEQGKTEAGSDILLPLLQRLGIQYEQDAAFLHKAKTVLSDLWEDLLSGEEIFPPFTDNINWLIENQARCLVSEHMLDTLLFLSYANNVPEETLQDFLPCLSARQYAFYLLIRLQTDPADPTLREELLRLDPSPFICCCVGTELYRTGKYPEAIDLLSRAYDLAAREGSVYLMLQAKTFLGNCYSDSGQTDLMQEHYRVARKLAKALNEQHWINEIDYNLASTLLEWRQADQALQLLLAIPRKDALFYHKQAVALEILGRTEEASAALLLARDTADPAVCPPIHEMLDLVAYRLTHPDYLRDKIYCRMVENTFSLLQKTLPSGYARFHLPYLLEVLESERRYRDAYRLSLQFSVISGLKTN